MWWIRQITSVDPGLLKLLHRGTEWPLATRCLAVVVLGFLAVSLSMVLAVLTLMLAWAQEGCSQGADLHIHEEARWCSEVLRSCPLPLRTCLPANFFWPLSGQTQVTCYPLLNAKKTKKILTNGSGVIKTLWLLHTATLPP